MGDDARIDRFLANVRRRLRLRQAVEEFSTALGTTLLALLVLLLAAPSDLPVGTLRAICAGVVALGAGGAVAGIVRPFRRWRAIDRVARLVGERTGAGDRFLSAVELSRALPSLDREPQRGSPALARAHVAEVARGLTAAHPRSVAPFLPPPRTLAAAGLVSALYLVVLVAARRKLAAAAMALLTLSGPAGRARPAEPIIGDIELHLELPPHTGEPPRVIGGSSGEVLAPPGTVVRVRARPLLPIRAARLQLEDAAGHAAPAVAARLDAGRLEAQFTVGKEGGAYRFLLEQSALQAKGLARTVPEPEAHRIEVQPDRAPRVTLAAPAEELDLDAPRPVELAWSAEDDYGLGDVDLVWESAPGRDPDAPKISGRKRLRTAGESAAAPAGTEGGADRGAEDPTAGPARKGASGRLEWDLTEVGLPPGVRLNYHVEARDNDAVSGPNVGSSRVFGVRIYSATERHDDLLGETQALVDKAVELLADRLEPMRTALPGDALAPRLGLAHGRTDDLLADAGKLRAASLGDPLAPRDLSTTLQGIAQRLGKLQQGEAGPLGAFTRAPDDGEARRSEEQASARHATELERDVLLLDDLLGRQRLEQLLATTDSMQQARDRLRALLGEYRRSPSDALRADIEREIRALEQKLAELSEKAGRLAHEIPDEYLRKEAVAGADVGSRLEALRERVKKGDIDGALDEMKRLSASLDKMAASLEGDLRGYRGERFSAEERALAELESKVSDLEHDERQLQGETEAVRAREREEARKLAQSRVEPVLRRARDKVAEIKRRLASAERDQLTPDIQDNFDGARRQFDRLGGALAEGDLDEAAQLSQQAAAALRQLSFELRDEEERRWTGARASLRRTRDKVDESEPQARQMADELDALLPRAGSLLPPEERQKLERLAERQQALGQRVDELRRELEKRGAHGGPPSTTAERGGSSPVKPGEGASPGPLRAAGEHMERATEALRSGNARGGAGEEAEASEQLAGMRRGVQNERRPRPDGSSAAMGAKEPVRIPGADEFRAPREFRQDLLEAMKRAAPGEYKRQVKRYYEELVK